MSYVLRQRGRKFTDEERAAMLAEYFSGKSSGIIARKYKCSSGFVRGLAFYYINGIKPHLVNAYKNGEYRRDRISR